jgi:DNA-binding IclR family transcriptional regulator
VIETMMALELSQTRTLTIRAAIIEHLRWEAYNIPSTVSELADGIGRNRSAVRRVVRRLYEEGTLARLSGSEHRYMLAVHSDPGARLVQ